MMQETLNHKVKNLEIIKHDLLCLIYVVHITNHLGDRTPRPLDSTPIQWHNG